MMAERRDENESRTVCCRRCGVGVCPGQQNDTVVPSTRYLWPPRCAHRTVLRAYLMQMVPSGSRAHVATRDTRVNGTVYMHAWLTSVPLQLTLTPCIMLVRMQREAAHSRFVRFRWIYRRIVNIYSRAIFGIADATVQKFWPVWKDVAPRECLIVSPCTKSFCRYAGPLVH